MLMEREVPKDFALAACNGVDAFAKFQPWFIKSDSRYAHESTADSGLCAFHQTACLHDVCWCHDKCPNLCPFSSTCV